MICRHCAHPLVYNLIDLGFAPPSNAYLTSKELAQPEVYFPLQIKVCHHCWLVQTEDYADPDTLFKSDYAYFSSTSSSWLAHAKAYAETMTHRLALDRDSFVLEIAANDGYLLKNFVAAGIPCLGIEPTAGTAAVARATGIPIRENFFSEALGKEISQETPADLIVGNNVYAHVPDINNFTRGLKAALKPRGCITLEFPHLLNLMQETQFDTLYHEHFSYLSLYTAKRIFESAGLRVWDVEKLPTHGGSLRLFGCHDTDPRPTSPSVEAVLIEEREYGLQTLAPYAKFQARANQIKNDLLVFLLEQKRQGACVAAYGAAAKGNTLLNYAGIKPDLLPFVCDAAPAKQGKFLPGSHIPILPPSALYAYQPDYILILPWNIAPEIRSQLGNLKTRFVTAVPSLRIQ